MERDIIKNISIELTEDQLEKLKKDMHEGYIKEFSTENINNTILKYLLHVYGLSLNAWVEDALAIAMCGYNNLLSSSCTFSEIVHDIDRDIRTKYNNALSLFLNSDDRPIGLPFTENLKGLINAVVQILTSDINTKPIAILKFTSDFHTLSLSRKLYSEKHDSEIIDSEALYKLSDIELRVLFNILNGSYPYISKWVAEFLSKRIFLCVE